MEVLYPRCAGLDLGNDMLVACVRIHGRPVQQEVRTFATTTRELLGLAAWLTEHGVTHVAIAGARGLSSRMSRNDARGERALSELASRDSRVDTILKHVAPPMSVVTTQNVPVYHLLEL